MATKKKKQKAEVPPQPVNTCDQVCAIVTPVLETDAVKLTKKAEDLRNEVDHLRWRQKDVEDTLTNIKGQLNAALLNHQHTVQRIVDLTRINQAAA